MSNKKIRRFNSSYFFIIFNFDNLDILSIIKKLKNHLKINKKSSKKFVFNKKVW